MSLKTLREKAAIEDTSLLSVGGLVEQLSEPPPVKKFWAQVDEHEAARKEGKVPLLEAVEAIRTKRWDVFIYEFATRKIESVAGTDMKESGSFYTVEKRLEVVASRLNDRFGAIAVPAGKFKKGDVLPKDVETYEG